MKTIYSFLIVIVLLIQGVSSLQAQTTEGKEFWLTFGNNGNTIAYWLGDFQIRIVSGENPTTGTIRFTKLKDSVLFSMGAFEVFTYSFDNTQKEAVYNATTGKSDRTVHINSSEPVKVYALNQFSTSADATNIFPIEVLGNNYYQITYTSFAAFGTMFNAYAVVAIEDGTEIFHDNSPVMMLDAGEVYYQTSLPDMTGAHITANNPVAFFALHMRARIPSNYDGTDHLFQQLPPVNTWGKNFFVPVSHLTKDRVRIVASQGTTTITQTGGIFIYSSSGSYTINAGEYIELEALLTNNGCYIHADKPVGVCTYLTGYYYNGSNPVVSDPSQAWLPAIEQMGKSALIAPFIPTGNSQLNQHYAIIITSFDTKENTKVSIDGGMAMALSGGDWYDNAEMSFYIIPLYNDTASYYFTNNAGLIVMGYGTGAAESYYYLAGSAMRELDAAFYANEVHFQDLKDTIFCAGNVNFQAAIENMGVEMDSIKWYINGIEETAKRDSLEWTKFFPFGEYEITMWVRFENDSVISKTGTLRIKNCEQNATFYVNNVHCESLQDTVFCNKNVFFRAEIEGQYEELKWYIGGVEEISAQNQEEWNKEFTTGEYEIKMEVHFEDHQISSLTKTLKMNVFWIKIRNLRY